LQSFICCCAGQLVSGWTKRKYTLKYNGDADGGRQKIFAVAGGWLVDSAGIGPGPAVLCQSNDRDD
jgi:hypothetical protein